MARILTLGLLLSLLTACSQAPLETAVPTATPQRDISASPEFQRLIQSFNNWSSVDRAIDRGASVAEICAIAKRNLQESIAALEAAERAYPGNTALAETRGALRTRVQDHDALCN